MNSNVQRILIVILILQTQWRTFGLSRQIMAWGNRISKRIDDPSQRQSPEEWSQEWKEAMADLRNGKIGFWVEAIVIVVLMLATVQ
jgi:hypothetical protein